MQFKTPLKTEILLGILFIPLFIFFLYYRFQLKKVIIISQNKEIRGLSVFNKANLLLLNNEQIIYFLLSKNMFIKSIKLSKSFPSSEKMEVIWRMPYAEIISSRDPFYIDSEGFPAESDTAFSQIPQIYSPNIIINNASPDWRLKKAVYLINLLDKKNLHLAKIAIDNNSQVFTGLIDDSIEIIIPLNSDPQVVSASLQTIISRFRIEGKFIAKIDFKFEKPVVILKNEQ